jgi:DNA-binding transcriptional regulator LsrR (DeoR family)
MKSAQIRRPGSIADNQAVLESLQVAYYHCVLQMPLKSVAVLLDRSPATVTRRLEEARRRGWVHDHPEFTPPQDVWRELQCHMTCGEAERALVQALGAELLPRVTVLPSTVRPETEARATRPELVERIGLHAAAKLAEALSVGPHVVGLNWGWSVRQCVLNLRPPKPNPEVRFVPLVGSLSLDENDPHFEEAIECSSNRLAQAAAAAFQGPRPSRLSTPAYIPRKFSADTAGLSAIRRFITEDVSYQRVFGEGGWMEAADTVVTGLSSIDVQSLPDYRPDLITAHDVPALQRAGVVGDLALHLMTDPARAAECSEEDAGLVQEINSLLVGAGPDDLRRIAQRARQSGAPGVIVLATGPWKADILLAAIRHGAVNELVTDLETAMAIGRRLGVRISSRISIGGGKG